MGSGVFFPACSLFYSVLLIILCFKVKKVDNKIIKTLAIVNFIGLIVELLCTFAAFNIDKLPLLSNFILKFYLVCLISWTTLFTLFTSKLSDFKKKRRKIEDIVFSVGYIVLVILAMVLPIGLFNEGIVRYTYGPGVSMVYGVSLGLIIYCLILMFFNIKKAIVAKYSSLFILISVGAFAMVVQSSYPGLLLVTSVQTFVTIIMYITTLLDEDHQRKVNK